MHILFWFLISEGESINYNPIFSVEREREREREIEREREREREREGGREGGRRERTGEYKYFKLTELCLAPRPLPNTDRVLREMNITMA